MSQNTFEDCARLLLIVMYASLIVGGIGLALVCAWKATRDD
jgi:hypothetical protein